MSVNLRGLPRMWIYVLWAYYIETEESEGPFVSINKVLDYWKIRWKFVCHHYTQCVIMSFNPEYWDIVPLKNERKYVYSCYLQLPFLFKQEMFPYYCFPQTWVSMVPHLTNTVSIHIKTRHLCTWIQGPYEGFAVFVILPFSITTVMAAFI